MIILAEEPVPQVTQNYSCADELSQIISSYLKIKQILEGLPTQHLNTDGCPTGDSAVQQITNGSHFNRGEDAPRWRLDCPRKRDIKGNGTGKKNGKWKITTCPEGIEWNWKCLGMRGGKTTQQLILWWPWQAAEVGPQLLQFVLELRNFYCQQKGGKFEEERGVGFLSMRTEHISGQMCGHANHMGPFTGVYKCQSQTPWHHQEERRAKRMPFQSSNPCFSNICTGVQRWDSKFHSLTLQVHSRVTSEMKSCKHKG